VRTGLNGRFGGAGLNQRMRSCVPMAEIRIELIITTDPASA
jgi:hypothetical protein